MGSGQAGVSWWAKMAKSMRECGSTVNSWVLESDDRKILKML